MTKLSKLVAPAVAAAVALAAIVPAQARDTDRGFNKNAPAWSGMKRTASRNMHDYHPVAVPARRYGNSGIRAEIVDLQRDIERAAARRMLSRWEAIGLRSDANRLERLYWSYSRNGLNRHEVASLNGKIARLRVALRIDMHDRDRRRG